MSELPKDKNGHALQILAPTTPQIVTIGTTSAQSAAFIQKVIRFTPTAACFFVVGANPVATAQHHFAAANMPYPELPVSPGDKIAFILAAGTGTVYITELA